MQTSSIFILGLALKFLTPVYTPKPTIIDVVFYPRVKFPTLILEHHNDSLMLLYVNMLRTARGGIASAFHRNVAANIQIKIERAKKKGGKLAVLLPIYYRVLCYNELINVSQSITAMLENLKCLSFLVNKTSAPTVMAELY